MLNYVLAERKLKTALPTATIEDHILYRNVYLFRVNLTSRSEAEQNYDPFYSVDLETGEVRDFSILTDGDINEITRLFLNNKRGR